jgi:hypothetical protein
MNSGRCSGHSFLNHLAANMAKAARDENHEKYLKASVGYCEPARSGLIYLSVIRPTKRVIGVFKSGRGTACCGRFEDFSARPRAAGQTRSL